MEERYKDRTASLIVLGIMELLGGLLCACFALISAASLVLPRDAVSVQQIVPGILVYVFLSVWLIWMAIGTIRARRWARSLMLAASWLALVCGIFAMGMMFIVMPKSLACSQVSEEMIRPVLAIIYISMAVFYLLIPAVGVLFYGNRNVRATFEHSDPVPSWTERCPVAVLVLVMMLMLAAVSMAALCFFRFAMPFFGVILSGWPGALVVLGIMVICCSLAVSVFKLRPAAWWCALALLVLGMVSQLITFGRIDVMDYYVTMGYTDQMLQRMQNMDWMNGTTLGIMTGSYAVPALIYLLWVKRYFRKEEAQRI